SSIAMDADGDYVVTWSSDGQNGLAYGIYAQRYNAAGVPQGAEFQVSSSTTISQKSPSIAMDADGDFVITWSRPHLGGTNVFAKRFNALGVAQGSEFQVNTWTTDNQHSPSIGMDADGDFVITWHSSSIFVVSQDGSYHGIFAQRYNAAGVPQGFEFRVNSWTTDSQTDPSIAMDASGDFVITWKSEDQDGDGFGIYAQRFNQLGVVQGSEFLVNSTTTGWQRLPSIAMDADGDFVIAWTSDGQDGSGSGIYARRFDQDGVPQGSEFQVNTWTTFFQDYPAVGMDAEGDFVITWESDDQDGSGVGIYAQRYNQTGVPLGSEFRINSFTGGSQNFPTIGMNASGDFVIAWDSQDGSAKGVFAQRYNSLGVMQGAEFQVNTNTINDQRSPSVGIDADGDFVIAWQSYGHLGVGIDVFVQRYNAAGEAQGLEPLVNTERSGHQSSPTIGIDDNGNFVIAWEA
ncbi:MAG: hypothetical protein KDA36_12515, partial [Planctomycetaceae bacterium]|nr:hypothetical protein [Planctomycetaceae bacterium]